MAERFQEDGVPYEGDAMRSRASFEEEGRVARVFLFADYALDDAIIDDLPYMRLAAFDILRRETDSLTAILAALYNEVAGRESREAVLGKKH